MPARAIASGVISFGLVSIPVKLYTSASSEQVRFNMLDARHGVRVKQQYYSPVDNKVLGKDEIVKGYEYARDQFVTFTDEELKALEADRSNHIEIVEFVPLETFDFVQIEKTYYLGADKGGDKAYTLLSRAMEDKDKVAVGRWAARGKEQLVIVRPYKEGLILHQLYYANEVRSFAEANDTATMPLSDKELDLAEKLIDQLSSDEFDPARYKDDYADRVREVVDQKVAGKEVVVAAEAPRAQIIDLFEALKRSIADTRKSEEAAESEGGEEKTHAPRVKKAEPRKAAGGKKKSAGG
ncbi:MAG TPA: Ku protein [Polyangiaceae bacterium]|nr:Ku protein [Polyangiaceae bacterium]